MYLPVRVSILIAFSPVLMNSGACAVMPVSMVTAFLHVVGGIAPDAFGRIGHSRDDARRDFHGDSLVVHEVTVTPPFSRRVWLASPTGSG